MRIGVIGAGWMGQAVAAALARAGHDIMLSSRHPEDLEEVAREMGASAGTVEAAAAFGAAVLLTAPYRAMAGLAAALEHTLAGKIVLDATNPYPPDDAQLIREVQAEGVASHSARLFPSARLVRCFSAVDALDVEASSTGRRPKLGVPVAGNDAEAVGIAAGLVRDAGCEPVIAGGLADAAGFQRGGPGFRANTGAPRLRRLLGLPDDA